MVILNANVQGLNSEAFIALPKVFPLENPINVPPSSWEMVMEENISGSGGI